MFESGEKYVLFLKETEATKSNWIMGEETGMFQILDDSTIVKLAAPIEEFKYIEVERNNQNTRSLESFKNDTEQNIQVIHKEEFINIVKKQINMNKGEN